MFRDLEVVFCLKGTYKPQETKLVFLMVIKIVTTSQQILDLLNELIVGQATSTHTWLKNTGHKPLNFAMNTGERQTKKSIWL